jgi:hypothetical protein
MTNPASDANHTVDLQILQRLKDEMHRAGIEPATQ